MKMCIRDRLSDGGNARRIALCLAALIRRSKHNRQFYCVLMVPVLYFLLCYAGISGFVVVFTVLPIAKDLFEETNTPWRLYCCAGAQTVNAVSYTHLVWFEDPRSQYAKFMLIKEYGLSGVGYWQLMNYDRANWLLLNELFEAEPGM